MWKKKANEDLISITYLIIPLKETDPLESKGRQQKLNIKGFKLQGEDSNQRLTNVERIKDKGRNYYNIPVPQLS